VPAVVLIALALLFPAAASADSYFPVKGAPAPGAAKYDKVWVEQIGPASARHVLVLIAGSHGAAGSLTFAGRDIQERLGSDWQIWIEDRREVAFDDLTGFESGDPAAAKDYYLGFKYKQTHTKGVPFVRKWGMAVELNDLHNVVKRARAGGRRVVLGGHSFGAVAAMAYAAWDFKGRAGYKDVDGIVLIDGGLKGTFTEAVSLRRAKKEKAKIDKGEAFSDILGAGNPSIAQIFAELAALYALKQPADASALQSNVLVPASLRPAFPVTNAAFLGNILDKDTAFAESLSVRAGTFAAEGDPRPWADGENMTIARLAAAFAQQKPRFSEWYYPSRLGLDSIGADSMSRNAVTKLLGLRLWHTKQINVPLFAYQTDLTHGGVIRGARAVQKASKIPRLVEVDDSASASHLDPVIAPPEFNGFTQNVVPFLKSLP
jgi:pimeloyl-ACP methyl ester carboxylesterase